MQTIQEQAAHIRRLQEQLVALRNGQPLPPLDTRGSNPDSYREASANDAPEPEVRNWIISAVSEQSEDEGSTYEEEDEELGSSYGMTAVSQASSGDSQRGIPSRVLRSITTTIPSEASPLGMMASLSIQASSSSGPKRGGRGSDHVEEEGVGLTEPLYFEKGKRQSLARPTLCSQPVEQGRPPTRCEALSAPSTRSCRRRSSRRSLLLRKRQSSCFKCALMFVLSS
jgi:hypothetical protein